MQQLKLTNKLIGLAVLGMFVTAIVAGQARGNADTDSDYTAHSRVAVPHRPAQIMVSGFNIAPLVSTLREVESVRPLVDAVLEAPIQINFDLQNQQLTVTRQPGLRGHD